MKNWLLSLAIALTACSANNNISLLSTAGECADGTISAPYCMSINIQNNIGGQNYINSTNFPISNIIIKINGVQNIAYPSSIGSSYDPNNCLTSTLAPGDTCKFYLALNAEAFALGQKQAATVQTTYTINDQLFGTSSNTATTITTIYEVPELLISNTAAYIQPYNNMGFGNIYRAESVENTINAIASDNYYGFLYLAGTNNIYLAGNMTALGTLANIESTSQGATNVLANGNTLYTVPVGSLAADVYSYSIATTTWAAYATGLPATLAPNLSAISNNTLFFGDNYTHNVYLCDAEAECTIEGDTIPEAANINALAVSNLDQAIFSGLVVGASNGLWAETIGNKVWYQIQNTAEVGISANINKIAADSSHNLYIAAADGTFYQLLANATSKAAQYKWKINNVAAIAVDNVSQKIYLASDNTIYSCDMSIDTDSCTMIGNSALQNIISLNLISTLQN